MNRPDGLTQGEKALGHPGMEATPSPIRAVDGTQLSGALAPWHVSRRYNFSGDGLPPESASGDCETNPTNRPSPLTDGNMLAVLIASPLGETDSSAVEARHPLGASAPRQVSRIKMRLDNALPEEAEPRVHRSKATNRPSEEIAGFASPTQPPELSAGSR